MNTDHQGLQSVFIRVVILVGSVFVPCVVILGDTGCVGMVHVDPGSQHGTNKDHNTDEHGLQSLVIRVHPGLSVTGAL